MTMFGLLSRLDAILHKILHPSHDIIWKWHESEEDKEICDGDILCKTCDKIYWCRALEKIKDE
jgi:hypothetical protein